MTNAEILKVINSLQVGNMVQINDWDKPMIVRGVSEHYVVVSNLFDNDCEYTILSREPNTIAYNGIPCGACICAADWWLFGILLDGYNDFEYHFANQDWTTKYLESLEKGETEMSLKNRAIITNIKIGYGG